MASRVGNIYTHNYYNCIILFMLQSIIFVGDVFWDAVCTDGGCWFACGWRRWPCHQTDNISALYDPPQRHDLSNMSSSSSSFFFFFFFLSLFFSCTGSLFRVLFHFCSPFFFGFSPFFSFLSSVFLLIFSCSSFFPSTFPFSFFLPTYIIFFLFFCFFFYFYLYFSTLSSSLLSSSSLLWMYGPPQRRPPVHCLAQCAPVDDPRRMTSPGSWSRDRWCRAPCWLDPRRGCYWRTGPRWPPCTNHR